MNTDFLELYESVKDFIIKYGSEETIKALDSIEDFLKKEKAQKEKITPSDINDNITQDKKDSGNINAATNKDLSIKLVDADDNEKELSDKPSIYSSDKFDLVMDDKKSNPLRVKKVEVPNPWESAGGAVNPGILNK